MIALIVWLFVPPAASGPGSPRFLDMLRDSPSGRLYWLAVEEKWLQGDDPCAYGRMVKVTEDTITIRGPSGCERTFEVSPDVASKAIPLNPPSLNHAYRLNQVRVGDLVSAPAVPTPRGTVVVALGIWRRPGGNIPPTERTPKEPRNLPENLRAACLNNKYQEEEIAQLYLLPSVRPLLPRFGR